ncbi:probable F-box protein At4g22030 [Magnolia sinica]|uniref:probable F-box protein At4g22030 n=1 Tax=Magnolia sinica TaxID=86752 RepID=UPI00265A5273|nr:probable F-box protein At4g22030 [Magnolia sinica]
MSASFTSSLLSSSFSPLCDPERRFSAILKAPKLRKSKLSFAKTPIVNMNELYMKNGNLIQTDIQIEKRAVIDGDDDDFMDAISKLYVITEAVTDRAEMHANVAEQRNSWNNLLVNSINAITLTATTMAGLSAISTGTAPGMALKVSSTILYSAATGLLLLVNKIQPSQLAEEQRNATRLFRQLYTLIQTTLALRKPTPTDVEDAMERVLALDKAYPLPLLPGMLDKFPTTVEPARWWPSFNLRRQKLHPLPARDEKNGWSGKLEEEMRGILEILRRNDIAEYVRLSKLVLQVNKIFSVSGPLLTGLAALGTSFIGSDSRGSWAMLIGIIGGALASIVNTVQHGGQVGMVFEMYRNCGGFYRLLEESIESNLQEREPSKRDNGELFEMKMTLELGRSLQELRNLAAATSSVEEFAGKLF